MDHYSSTSLYTSKEDYYYRPKESLTTIQAPYLTHKAVSNGPTFSYHLTDKYASFEPSTSNSLGSYKQMSPLKVGAPAIDLFDTFKRLVQTAISNKWTHNVLDSKWPAFLNAAKSLNSKQDLEDFFRDVTFKPEKKRPKSAPQKRKPKEDLRKLERLERPRPPPALQRHHSYNYETLYCQPPRPLLKSKSDRNLKPADHPEVTDSSKKVVARETKIQKLCERIEQGFARGMKTLVSRTTLY